MDEEMSRIRAMKTVLRSAITSSLNQLSTDEVARQSNNVHQCLISMPEYQSSKKIGVYLSMPSRELSTTSIVDHAIENGKMVFVPYIYRPKQLSSSKKMPTVIMDMLSLHSKEDYRSLKADKWGIPSLDAESIQGRESCFGDSVIMGKAIDDGKIKQSNLDIIIVPGVGFDRDMRRLGHGKGFYDFFLSRYHALKEQKQIGISSTPEIDNPIKHKMPPLVGLALVQQVLPEDQSLPGTSLDWQMSTLIIGDGSVIR